MWVMYPGGGSGMGGNLIPGPRYVPASRWSSSGPPPSVILASAVDDQVMLQTELVALLSLDRQGNARVALYVLDLPVARQVPAHDLVAVQAHPDAAHLRRSVWIQRYQVSQGRRLDDCAGAVGQAGHSRPWRLPGRGAIGLSTCRPAAHRTFS